MERGIIEPSSDETVAFIVSVYMNDRPMAVYWAMKSILSQTYSDILIFIRMDGDITSEVFRLLEFYSKNYENIFLSKNEKNCGLAISLNGLIDSILASYPNVKFIARMDADDVSSLWRIEKQISFFKENNDIDVLGTACLEFGIYNKTIIKYSDDRDIKKNIIKVTPFIHPSVVFKRNVFEDGNRYPTDTQLSEDLSLWLNLALRDYKFHNLNDVLLFYRLTDKTLKRRVGIRKAYSELKERVSYLHYIKNNHCYDYFYLIGHFFIRIMPIAFVKVLYKLLR